jgi:peptidase E
MSMSVGLRALAGLWFDDAESPLAEHELPEPPNTCEFERYFFSQFDGTRPSVAMLGTASGDSDSDVAAFYRRMSHADCRPTDISVTRYRYIDLESLVDRQNILYVGDGSAPNLVAIWRAQGLDALVKNGVSTSRLSLYAEGDSAAALFQAYDSRATGVLDVHADGLGIFTGSLLRTLSAREAEAYELPKPIYLVKPRIGIVFKTASEPYKVPSGDSGNAWRVDHRTRERFPLPVL